MEKVNLEFYVLNYDFNRKKVVNFNIFSNYYVYDETIKAVKEYLRKRMSYEDLTERIRQVIMYEEWARCEYEIMVGDLFEDDPTKFEKWDCYAQALPNIKLITDMAISRVAAQI